MKRPYGKKGSYTVFLAFFMSGMVIMSAAVIDAAHLLAIDSSVEDLGKVWANSIIGEYDRVLRDRYGFMGYYGNEDLVRKKLIRYSDYTFRSKKYLKVDSLECSLSEYKLTDLETFRDQMKMITLSFASPAPFDDDMPEDIPEDEETGESIGHVRRISSGWIIDSLPSHSYKGAGVSGSAAGTAFETLYVFKFFKDHVDERDLGKTYFNNEIEYIISGKLDDEKARKSVYNKLLAERNALNLVYLYSCSAKRQAALEAAEILTPGPEAVLTQALILEVWALLESRNDIELLYDGQRVPLAKGDENWALSLENAVDYFSNDGRELDTGERKKYVSPESIEGQKYEDYLMTLFLTVPEKKRLLRIMDLIQINMKYCYCDYFLMDDYYTGVHYDMEVKGKKHEFEVRYG
ncbi:MAG: hypothetical protein IKS99_05275 [Firmicutes bacterium]|nr:hypothetical protein [Bacillota bacterium]